ncbi:60S ribosomal protein L23a-1 [Nymphaea thermarum]|nr:60S ribosomal protein L23a-1 [Nymphaea thermarum]
MEILIMIYTSYSLCLSLYFMFLAGNLKFLRTAPAKKPDAKAQALKAAKAVKPDGTKKAYVRLTPDYDALDVANKIGII